MKLCPKCQKQFSDDANFCPVDAARLVPYTGADAGGDSLSARFTLDAKLGGGRTGAVHRATDKTTHQACAVKLVAPAVVALPGVAQRLERELKQLERVQSHGVARLIASGKRGEPGQGGAGQAGGEWWVATELVDNAQTLAEAITTRGPIPPDRAAELVEVIGEALIEAAQVGVVHRDLAPKNVLFAGQDVKLVNFSLPVPGAPTPGVPEFVAPEQVEGKPVDQRSNLYSLGAIYYFVLTGQPVFAGSPAEVLEQHAKGAVRPPSQLAPQAIAAGSPIEGAILRALDKSPTRRFLTVRQFVDEVRRVGHAEVIELTQTLPMGRTGKPRAELVHTLMGFSGNGMAPLAAPAAPATSAPPAVALAAAAAAQPALKPSVGAQTVLGVPSAGLPASVAAPTGMPPLTPPDRSPWAAPGAAAPSPAATPAPGAAPAATAAAPIASQPTVVVPSAAATLVPSAPIVPPVAAPAAPVVPQAPVVAAPVVAAPVVAGQPAGKKRPEEPGSKGKFRETMWFKKGELDAQAAQNAAEERAKTGKDAATDKADTLPIDERYKDDGSITGSDKEKYSLRTGATQMMPSMRDVRPGSAGPKVSEDALIGEMKGGRGKIVALILAAVVGVVVLILLLVR